MERNDIYETLKFYRDNSKPVHINLTSGKWFNGTITTLHDDRVVIQEEKYGEMMILFERIMEDGIMPREERE